MGRRKTTDGIETAGGGAARIIGLVIAIEQARADDPARSDRVAARRRDGRRFRTVVGRRTAVAAAARHDDLRSRGDPPQQINIRKVIVHGWPLAYLEDLRQRDGSFYSPIMARRNERHAPQPYEPDADTVTTAQHRVWREVFHDYGLKNIAAHGIHDVVRSVTSYLIFPAWRGAWTHEPVACSNCSRRTCTWH